tara:strand:+ start:381 stop:1658 length:1278 start_codon:yes stop_codon:yes gene_type:complete
VLPLLAQAQTVTLSDTYALHSNDTLSLARALLADRITQEAVRQNGQYVAIDQTLTQDGFAGESIHVLASGLVEVVDQQEQVTTDSNGRLVLTMQKTLRLDPDSLQRRIDALHTNHEQAIALRQLAAENQRLREQRGVLMDHQRYGDPVARAQAFERWQHELANWQERSVGLEEIAKAQEALITPTPDPQTMQDTLHYRLEQVRRQLESQLQPTIVNQVVLGDLLELEIRVTGLRNAEAMVRDAIGFPLADDGLLYPQDYQQWPEIQQQHFRQVFPRLGLLPLYVTVEAGHERNSFGVFERTTRRGYNDRRYAGQSFLLFGTLLYRPHSQVKATQPVKLDDTWTTMLAQNDYFSTNDTGFRGSMGQRMTLGIAPPHIVERSREVTVESDDAVRVKLTLSAERGVPPYILARASLGGWQHFERQGLY